MSTVTKITIEVGEKLFEFSSLEHWSSSARRYFQRSNVRSGDVVCVDTLGRVCNVGTQFMRADREGTYPITAYRAVGS